MKRRAKGDPPYWLRAFIFWGISWSIASLLVILGADFYAVIVPLNSRFVYYSLLIAATTAFIMTRLVDNRPLISLGLRISRLCPFYLLAGTLVGLLVHMIIMVYIIVVVYKRHLIAPFVTFTPEAPLYLARDFAVALTEELYYRSYILQSLITSMGKLPAVLLVSLAFGFSHFNDWKFTVSAIMFGILLSVFYVRTQSLWLPIGFHFGWNFASRGSLFFLSGSEPLEIGQDIHYVTNAIVLALGILLALLLPLRPHPRDRELWDRYVKPAPWPPWRRRAEEPHELEVPGSDGGDRREPSAGQGDKDSD